MENSTDTDTNAATAGPSGDNDDSFLQTLKKAAENLINLKIVTVVGDVELSGDIQHPQVQFTKGGTDTEQIVIVTNINLIDSDITTAIPTKYENQVEGTIMKYHKEQVTQANATMDQKVKLIESLIKDIGPLFGIKLPSD